MEHKGLKLAPIFSNGMILQRDSVNLIYGNDKSSNTINLMFTGKLFRTKTDENGDFLIELPPVPAGGTYDMTVEGSESIHITDILFGDVFLLTGQSNMELPIRRVLDVSEQEIAQTCEPMIRQYLLPPQFEFNAPPKYMYESTWQKACGQELMGFSAAGYFFSKEIKEAYKVPVGLILAAAGGSRIESWMTEEAVKEFKEYPPIMEEYKERTVFEESIKQQQITANQWLEQLEEKEITPKDLKNFKNWDICKLPALISDYQSEPFCGSVYLCREIEWEEEQGEEAGLIYMGTIIDSDRIWINGKLVGRTEYRYPPRKYTIPPYTLNKGRNLITIRMVINNQNGGTIKGRPYYIACGSNKKNLEGDWYYKIGKAATQPMPQVLFPPSLPIGLFHTAIVPLSNLSLKGILWYQGESNAGNPNGYAAKFDRMLSDWRKTLKKVLPCIYVQLPGYREPLNMNADPGWAELREQQRQCLTLDQVAMVTALDLGEYNDLHPQNKKAVGVRLAKAGQYLFYKEEAVAYSGPLPERAVAENNQAIITFKYLEATETVEELNLFELAGSNEVYYPAKAIRRGERVTVTSPEVLKPAYVRYAWQDNAENINFYNQGELPAPCFRLEVK